MTSRRSLESFPLDPIDDDPSADEIHIASGPEIPECLQAPGPDDGVYRSPTGAVRSSDTKHLSFSSISPIAMIALARTLGEGLEKYAANNWEQGFTETDIYDHIFRHQWMDLAGDTSEPHQEHAFCGQMFLIHIRTLMPGLSDGHRRGQGCSVTTAMAERIARELAAKADDRAAGKFARAGEWTLAEVPEIARILSQREAQ